MGASHVRPAPRFRGRPPPRPATCRRRGRLHPRTPRCPRTARCLSTRSLSRILARTASAGTYGRRRRRRWGSGPPRLRGRSRGIVLAVCAVVTVVCAAVLVVQLRGDPAPPAADPGLDAWGRTGRWTARSPRWASVPAACTSCRRSGSRPSAETPSRRTKRARSGERRPSWSAPARRCVRSCRPSSTGCPPAPWLRSWPTPGSGPACSRRWPTSPRRATTPASTSTTSPSPSRTTAPRGPRRDQAWVRLHR